MKSQILDVYQESKLSFRACVIEVVDNYFGKGEQGVKVVNLSTGETLLVHHYECENPIIENILAIDPSDVTVEEDLKRLAEFKKLVDMDGGEAIDRLVELCTY